jgi:hypothetical protein
MFIKWIRNKKGGGVLIAKLVESKRVDGKSRQRVLAHLGTCREPASAEAEGFPKDRPPTD